MPVQPTIESFVRTYRKAVLTNDHRLAIQSLRHLVQKDKLRDWRGTLVQAEKALQTQLEMAFEVARAEGDLQMAERLAREYLAEPWLEAPTGNTAIAMRAFIDGFDARVMNNRAQGIGSVPKHSTQVAEITSLSPAPMVSMKLIIVTAAIVAVAIAVACVFLFKGRQDRAKPPQNQSAPQQSDETPTHGQDPETVFAECKVVVQGLSRELRSRITEISKSEKPDDFSALADDAKRTAVEAMEKARVEGVDAERLASVSKEFESAVRDFENAMTRRREVISSAEENETTTEEDSGKPQEPTDTSPPFMKADKVVVIGQNTLGDQAFLASHEGGFQVFHYSTEGCMSLAREDVKRVKGPGGFVFKPTFRDINARNKGNFIIYYSEADKTAYWLWTLPRSADKGEQWFAAAANGTSDAIDLRKMTFGNSGEVYKFYESHLGEPTYAISRSVEDGVAEQAVKMESMRHTKNAIASYRLFAPDPEEIAKVRDGLRSEVEKQRARLDGIDRQAYEYNRKAEEFYTLVERLIVCLEEVQTTKVKIKKLDYSYNWKDKNEKEHLQKQLAEIERKKILLAEQMANIAKVYGIYVHPADLVKCANRTEITHVLRRTNSGIVDSDGRIKYDTDAEKAKVQKMKDAAQRRLDDFTRNPESTWLPIVSQSRYAITAVVGSGETKEGRR